jgi:hypothetical protein
MKRWVGPSAGVRRFPVASVFVHKVDPLYASSEEFELLYSLPGASDSGAPRTRPTATPHGSVSSLLIPYSRISR